MIEFTVSDMTCGHCAANITKAVKAVDAAAQPQIDLATHKVRIDSHLGSEPFRIAIEDAGYTPVLD